MHIVRLKGQKQYLSRMEGILRSCEEDTLGISMLGAVSMGVGTDIGGYVQRMDMLTLKCGFIAYQGKDIGFVHAFSEGDVPEVSVYVDPYYRGRNVATTLISHLQTYVPEMTAIVYRNNHQMRSFINKFTGQEIGNRTYIHFLEGKMVSRQ